MTASATRPLNKRERATLEALVQLHQEHGLTARFTSELVAKAVGSPCPGSLAGLTISGLCSQRQDRAGVVYQLTEAGWASFAGIIVP